MKRGAFLNKNIFFEAVGKYGTPLYLYDLDEIKRRIKIAGEMLDGLNYRIFFAMKANSNPHLLKFIRSSGLGVDTVSINEYKMALFSGFTANEIVVNGNGKSKEDLNFYANESPLCVNVDSPEEIEKFPNSEMRVALRINPDVNAKTHPHISTGLKENKFGMDFDSARKTIKYMPPNLKLVALHCHIGSQISDISPFKEAFRSLKKFIDDEKLDLEFLNVGGGWGIDYFDNDDGIKMKDYRSEILPILSSFGIPVYFELGRFIIGSSGYLLTKVTEIKRTPYKNFIVVDSSMADLIRPSLYDAHHEIEFLSEGEKIVADIVGRVCESGDILAKKREVNCPQIGQIGVIHDVGAYGYSMASNYNLSMRPAEAVFDGKNLTLIRKRESFQNSFSEDDGEKF